MCVGMLSPRVDEGDIKRRCDEYAGTMPPCMDTHLHAIVMKNVTRPSLMADVSLHAGSTLRAPFQKAGDSVSEIDSKPAFIVR